MKRHFWRLILSRLGASALGSLAFVLVARSAAPKDLGALATVTAIAAIVLIVGDLGLSTSLSKEYARGEFARVRTGLRVNRATSVFLGLIGSLLVFSTAQVLHIPVATALIPLALSFDKNTDTKGSVCISAGNSKYPALSFFLRRLVPLIVFSILYFVVSLDPLWSYGIALVCGSVTGQLVLNPATRRILGDLHGGHHLSSTRAVAGDSGARSVIRGSIPFLIGNVSGNVRQLDVAAVTFFASPISGGSYAAASKLVQPLYLVPSVLSSLLLPWATRAERSIIVRLAIRLYVSALLATPIALALGFIARLLVVPVLGEEYVSSESILVALLTGLPLVVGANLLGSVLQAQGFQREVAVVSSLFAVLTLLMLAGGAGCWGGLGAAVALGVSYLLRDTVLILILSRRGARFGGRRQHDS